MKKQYFYIIYVFISTCIVVYSEQIDFNILHEFPDNHLSYERFKTKTKAEIKAIIPSRSSMYPQTQLKQKRKSATILQKYTPVKPLQFIGDCRGMDNILNKMRADVKCKPRPTLVTIVPDPGYIYFPDVILIDRCSGRCGHKSLSCIPRNRVNRKILVQRMRIERDSDSSCWELEVEMHTECICGCDLMPEDCNELEVYNEDDCICDCKNQECFPKNLKYWDSERCQCNCLTGEKICDKFDDITWISKMI